MRNVTLSLDELLLENAKAYAASKGQSLNAFVKGLIEREVKSSQGDSMRSFLEKGRTGGASSHGLGPMTREEIYRP